MSLIPCTWNLEQIFQSLMADEYTSIHIQGNIQNMKGMIEVAEKSMGGSAVAVAVKMAGGNIERLKQSDKAILKATKSSSWGKPKVYLEVDFMVGEDLVMSSPKMTAPVLTTTDPIDDYSFALKILPEKTEISFQQKRDEIQQVDLVFGGGWGCGDDCRFGLEKNSLTLIKSTKEENFPCERRDMMQVEGSSSLVSFWSLSFTRVMKWLRSLPHRRGP